MNQDTNQKNYFNVGSQEGFKSNNSNRKDD